MIEKITAATEDFFKYFEEKHGLEVSDDYIKSCIQSNIDTSDVSEFDSEDEVYNYFLEEYKLNESDVLEVVQNR